MFMLLKFLNFWFPVLVYSGIIFAASSIRDVNIPGGIPNSDKLIHVLEYMPFGFLLARALNSLGLKLSVWQLWVLVAFLTFGYGLTDEWHQSFVPGRTQSIFDALADLVGGSLGSWIWIKIKR
ncbi:MAG: VanZ family protein [Candidatus Omnitrophica bacterium]|nr:VanZ family protein [Candidatus Omnitrophota bacterium]